MAPAEKGPHLIGYGPIAAFGAAVSESLVVRPLRRLRMEIDALWSVRAVLGSDAAPEEEEPTVALWTCATSSPTVGEAPSAMLDDLARGGALTAHQAERLCAEWATLDRDTWSQPWFRQVNEHTRAFIGGFGI